VGSPSVVPLTRKVAEITGEVQGAYLQPFETVITLVSDDPIGKVGDEVYGFKNYYVVSKSKESSGRLVAGQEFWTKVLVRANQVADFHLGWDDLDDVERDIADNVQSPSLEATAKTSAVQAQEVTGDIALVAATTREECVEGDPDDYQQEYLSV
jgi:hypothetical protein